MLGVRFLDVDFMRINLACAPPTVWDKHIYCTVNRDAERPTGSARATLPETCCGDDGRPSTTVSFIGPTPAFQRGQAHQREGLGRHDAVVSRRSEHEPAACCGALAPPVGGTFHFENLIMPPLTKTCPKMVLPIKAVAFV